MAPILYNVEMKDLRARLENEKTAALWRDLSPHAQRNRVFVLRGSLDLVDMGEALVNNDTRRVEAWLANGQVSRPTPDEMQLWDATPGKFFDMLIVEPWVLIRGSNVPPVEKAEPVKTSIEELAKFAADRHEEE